jgi:cytochrome c-type biogenesis protein CcmF
MAVVAVGGAALIVARRRLLAAESPMASVWTRESFVLVSALVLILLSAVTTAGTLVVPVSKLIFGRQITVGAAFYNSVLVPTGLVLLATMALAPVLQWGQPPAKPQRIALFASVAAAIVAAGAGWACGLRSVIALAVTGLTALAASALAGSVCLDAWRTSRDGPLAALVSVIRSHRRQYAGFFIHAGFVCMAIGVTGSSLGTRRHEAILDEGETIEWAGRSIHYERLVQEERPDKLVARAVLQVTATAGRGFTLRPARHLHLLQNEWTTEVAIHSGWTGDFYTMLNSGEGDGRVSLTFVDNPLMRCIWLGGGVMTCGTVISLWPSRKRSVVMVSPARRAVAGRVRSNELVGV